MHIAFFISPHGYGHAARSCAVMEEMINHNPRIHFHVFTLVPDWFFRESLPAACFTIHALETDIGLVQASPLEIDINKTADKLNDFLNFSEDRITSIVRLLDKNNCRAVLCDISPLGFAAAKAAGIQSILIENFTWDWIYAPYQSIEPGFETHILKIAEIYNSADLHIQLKPVCNRNEAFPVVNPVSRKSKYSREKIRELLNIPQNAKAILISMGGIPTEHQFTRRLESETPDVYFIIPHNVTQNDYRSNLRILPHHSGFFHPDLVNACDAVIGKLGYSTLAEVYQAGIPFGYIERDDFRESDVMESFLKKNMRGLSIYTDEFLSGNWIDKIDKLLLMPRDNHDKPNGSGQCAEIIANFLK